VPSLPFLLRVDRTPDWGFSLTPVPAEGRVESNQPQRHGTGHVGRALRLSSRQLSPAEHDCAGKTPSATFTLYLRPAGEECRRTGLQGSWTCFDGFQGTMQALTWVGSCITFEFHNASGAFANIEESIIDAEEDLRDPAQQGVGGSCKMAFAEGSHEMSLTFRAAHEAGQSKEGHLELFVGQLGQGQPCFWQRGSCSTDANEDQEVPRPYESLPPLVLVLTMGMFFGSGPTPPPTGIPPGLPSLEVASALHHSHRSPNGG